METVSRERLAPAPVLEPALGFSPARELVGTARGLFPVHEQAAMALPLADPDGTPDACAQSCPRCGNESGPEASVFPEGA